MNRRYFHPTLSWQSVPHHLVDLLHSQAEAAGLEARAEEGLQQGSVVHALVKVIASNLKHVLRQRDALLQHRVPRHGGSLMIGHHHSNYSNTAFIQFNCLMQVYQGTGTVSDGNTTILWYICLVLNDCDIYYLISKNTMVLSWEPKHSSFKQIMCMSSDESSLKTRLRSFSAETNTLVSILDEVLYKLIRKYKYMFVFYFFVSWK